MSNNRLSEIPSNIRKLKKLKVLYISNNNLRTIPNEICELTHLIGLNLEGNPLKSDDEGLNHLLKLSEERYPYLSIITSGKHNDLKIHILTLFIHISIRFVYGIYVILR